VFAQNLGGANKQAVIDGARDSFMRGANWAYAAGIVLVSLGALLVWIAFPKRERESELLVRYETEDAPANA
jgi:hypothetical protein